MKILIRICSIVMLCSITQLQAQTIYNLNTIAQETTISVKDSQAVVQIEGSTSQYPLTKLNTEKIWKFKNPGDEQQFLQLLSIDAREIQSKWEHPIGTGTAAQQIITVAASKPAGIILKKKEEEAGGVLPSDRFNEAPQATITTNDSGSSLPWLWMAIIGLATFLIGFLLGKQSKKTPASSAPSTGPINEEEVVREFEAAVNATPKDASKITQVAKDKIAKLQADVKTYKQAEKDYKAQVSQLAQQINAAQKFRKTYFQQALKQLVTPYNEAIEKGNNAEAMKLLIQMAAHYSSMTKHELELKQDYDAANINALMKQMEAANLDKFPIINASTPLDRLPHHIKVLMDIMRSNQVSTLQDTIVYGYRIQS